MGLKRVGHKWAIQHTPTHTVIEGLLENKVQGDLGESGSEGGILTTAAVLWPSWLLCPWDFAGNNTGVGCYFLLQRIFPTQGSNLHVLHWQALAGEFFTTEPPGKPLTSYQFTAGGVKSGKRCRQAVSLPDLCGRQFCCIIATKVSFLFFRANFLKEYG